MATLDKKKSKNRYLNSKSLVAEDRKYGLEEAIDLLKKMGKAKFDESVELSFNMGIDPKKSNLMVRGTCPLPHGSGKSVKVLVFAEGDVAETAKSCGAEYVGGKDLIEKVKSGFTDFEAAISTPEMMGEVRKLGRVLGPRGLMPNPRTGTVTTDVKTAIELIRAGKVDYKLDKNANIAMSVGKVSFSTENLAGNCRAIIESVNKAKPSAAKGNYILNLTISSTMSPGIKLEPSVYIK